MRLITNGGLSPPENNEAVTNWLKCHRNVAGIFPDAGTCDRYDDAARLVDKPPSPPSIALIPRKSTIFRVGIKGVPDARTCMTRREAICLGISGRSEEHTSELQSLMRISYAVFCLKKKNINITKTRTQADHIKSEN